MLLAVALAEVFARLLPLDELWSQMLALCPLVVLWWLGFGRISRLFERQSDVIGAWTVGAPYNRSGDPQRVAPEGAAIFAQALQQVAYLNGIAPHQPNWRHGTIEMRVSYILMLGSVGGSRREVDRQVRQIKLLLWAMLAGGALLVAAMSLWGGLR
jgi:hypothetical protein